MLYLNDSSNLQHIPHLIVGYGHRNQAYEYVEGRVPPPMVYNAPPQIMAEGPMYYEHFRGPQYDPYSRRSNNQNESKPQYNFEDGGWSWE